LFQVAAKPREFFTDIAAISQVCNFLPDSRVKFDGPTSAAAI
jgi:hypothetical protein